MKIIAKMLEMILKLILIKWFPEGPEYYTHLEEGLDDMPAHIKSSILGKHINYSY